MAVFYAVEQGINLQKDGERLVVKKEGRVLKTIHFHNLELYQPRSYCHLT